MTIVVKKFGGTSVGSIEKIKHIATQIAAEIRTVNDGNKTSPTLETENRKPNIVLVVSAMGKTTDSLISLAHEITTHPNQREIDMLLTAGERITMALLSLALQEQGIQSISFTGSQSGIITDNSHGNAKILSVNAYRIEQELQKGKVVIVAGFQGVSLEKEITTLGRGGSDTTAVALACFLNAEKCEIFTDVEGVYTADPRNIPNAQKLDNITYEEMLYLTLTGSKVLHSRAAEFAYKYQIPTEIKSSFEWKEGTMIASNLRSQTSEATPPPTPPCKGGQSNEKYKGGQSNEKMEHSQVKAIAHKENIISITIHPNTNHQPPTTEHRTPPPIWHTEIFDMQASEKKVTLWIENKYENQLKNELNEYKISWTKDEHIYTIINMLGYRICRDQQFFFDLRRTLEKNCKHPYQISNQGIGVQIVINQSEAVETLQLLHSKYIEGEYQ